MRTSIYTERDPETGEWRTDDDAPRLDVSHSEPLSDETIEAFRALHAAVVARMESDEATE